MQKELGRYLFPVFLEKWKIHRHLKKSTLGIVQISRVNEEMDDSHDTSRARRVCKIGSWKNL